MADYPNLDELDKLWPDEGYAIIIEDEFKPPDSDDFVNMLHQSDTPDFELPPPKTGYLHWVHDADGNSYSREEWPIHQARYALTTAIKKVQNEQPVDEVLQQKRETAKERQEREDVIWFEVLLSISTWGNSRGDVLVLDEDHYSKVRYERVIEMDEEELTDHFRNALLDANVSYPNKKSEYLVYNLNRIRKLGGLEGAKQAFNSADGVQAKLDFLQEFKGISDKYSRNIPMDLYHPDFRDYIAVDDRIKDVLKQAGYPLEEREYEDHEEFLRSVAAELDMEPWALDRTLYNFKDNICDRLEEGVAEANT